MIALGVVLLGAMAAAMPASAVDQAPPDPPAASAPPESAEKLFRQGVDEYDAHNYRAAIASFKAAYDLSRAPEILFDIGQAYRALSDCRQAQKHFQAFVASTRADDPLLPRARARLDEFRSCGEATTAPEARAQVRAAKAPEFTALAPVPSAPVGPMGQLQLQPRDVPAPPRRSITRAVCLASGGAALTLGSVGGILAGKAHSLQVDVDHAPIWDDATKRADERGRAFADTSLALLITAGAAATVAVATCWMGWRSGQ